MMPGYVMSQRLNPMPVSNEVVQTGKSMFDDLFAPQLQPEAVSYGSFYMTASGSRRFGPRTNVAPQTNAVFPEITPPAEVVLETPSPALTNEVVPDPTPPALTNEVVLETLSPATVPDATSRKEENPETVADCKEETTCAVNAMAEYRWFREVAGLDEEDTMLLQSKKFKMRTCRVATKQELKDAGLLDGPIIDIKAAVGTLGIP